MRLLQRHLFAQHISYKKFLHSAIYGRGFTSRCTCVFSRNKQFETMDCPNHSLTALGSFRLSLDIWTAVGDDRQEVETASLNSITVQEQTEHFCSHRRRLKTAFELCDALSVSNRRPTGRRQQRLLYTVTASADGSHIRTVYARVL